MNPSHPPTVLLVLAVFLGGGLALAIIAQALWSRRRKSRRGFPLDRQDDP